MANTVNIGDKVRLLHGQETGVVTHIKGKYCVVHLDFGIDITYYAHELVPNVNATLTEKVKTHAAGKLIDTKPKGGNTRKATPATVDLHLNAKETQKIVNMGHLPLEQQIRQLNLFIIQAFENKTKELVVIHGVGKGMLKNEVLKYLQLHPKIKEVMPADAWKYGNGALKVVLK